MKCLDYSPQVGFSPLIRPFGFHLAVSHPGRSKWGQMPRRSPSGKLGSPHDSSRDTPVTCAPAKHSPMPRPAVATPQTQLTVTQTFFYFVVSHQSLPVLSPENAPVRLLPSWLEALWQPSNKFSPIALMHSSPPVLAPNQVKPSRA